MKWENLKLKEIASYWNGKIDAIELDETNYVSTENLVVERGGVINSSYVPTSGKANSYYENDVLVSNIRPYFKKIWFANKQGGCSNDVLVFRGNNKVYSKFLYYQLSKDAFFNYMVAGSNGTKMPRGNKVSIMEYQLSIPPLPTQRRIASILSAYDDLIENNLKRIKLLEEKAGLMYKILQSELSNSEKINLYDFADIQMGFAFKAQTFNEDGKGTPIVRIRDIPNQITKSFTTQEVDNHYWIEKGDLLIGMDGEFHMNEWLGQRGYLVQRVCRLRAKNPIYQSFLWQALKEPIHFYETTISGATVAHLGKKHLEEIYLFKPNENMDEVLEELNTMRKLKIVLAEQNTKLREARDILLPRLMNGEIEV